MPERYQVAAASDLKQPGSRVISECGGVEIAVFRTQTGYHAVANHCVHQGGPLCEGGLSGVTRLDDDRKTLRYHSEKRAIVCPWHGWTFDIETGRNIADPDYSVPTYSVEIEDGMVFVRV